MTAGVVGRRGARGGRAPRDLRRPGWPTELTAPAPTELGAGRGKLVDVRRQVARALGVQGVGAAALCCCGGGAARGSRRNGVEHG
eukprot:scaffold81970_cov22-Tisochrysis_lutea.AAC.6